MIAVAVATSLMRVDFMIAWYIARPTMSLPPRKSRRTPRVAMSQVRLVSICAARAARMPSMPHGWRATSLRVLSPTGPGRDQPAGPDDVAGVVRHGHEH